MTALIISFLALMSIPCFVILAIAGVRSLVFKKPWPATRELVANGLISVVITAAISVGICFGLKLSGFFESQFYRPSSRDYGEQNRVSAHLEDVRFASQDGTELHGWLLKVDDPIGTIIHCHGSDRNISFTIKNSEWLADERFNVFVFDYRGYGQSHGAPTRIGLVEDTVAAIRYVGEREDTSSLPICLWGQSMGGQLAVVAAAQVGDVPLRGVVSEATYGSYRDQIKDKTAQLGPLWLVQWAAWLLTNDDYSAIDEVRKVSPCPLLFVHGTRDRVVLPYHSQRLAEAAAEPVELWTMDVGHLQAFVDDESRRRLLNQLNDWCQ